MIANSFNARLSDIERQTSDLLLEQQAKLSAIAEATARNGADAITESIIKDCSLSERSRFDELLGQLDRGLLRSQLLELDRLFGRCASFFADRKQFMAARLDREVEVFASYVEQLSAFRGEDQSATFGVPQWQKLAGIEQTRSTLFADLVTAQDDIISELLTGKTASSEEIVTILQAVREINENLLLAKQQAEELRTSLTSL